MRYLTSTDARQKFSAVLDVGAGISAIEWDCHCRFSGLVRSRRKRSGGERHTQRKLAALDWELCALGDVMADVGFLLANWDGPSDPWPDVWMQLAPTRAGGFPTRAEMVARYAAQSGRDVHDVEYYQALTYWRIAIIAEGMKRRYESGAMSSHSVDIAQLERRVRERADLARHFLSMTSDQLWR